MEISGLRIGVHLTTALVSRHGAGGREIAQSLPPYGLTQVHDLVEYPDAPESWVRANAPNERTYFFGVPRSPERGIWFDFQSFQYDQHDVAVRVSMQGIDALSGMRADDTRLHWYKNNCPRHNTPFVSGRFCQQCNYAWPGVNFLSTSGARKDGATLWLDGFRNTEGDVRQAIFVDDPNRGVAAQLIGEDRSPAFAFVLRRSITQKPVEQAPLRRSLPSFGGDSGDRLYRGAPEVAAGALVHQRIGEDPNDPNYWQDEVAGVIRLYFAWQDVVDSILASHVPRHTGGFLGHVGNVGNPGSGGQEF